MMIHITPISTRLFTYHGDTNTFVAERSDLGNYDIQQPIYDDACDAGIALVSHKTDNLVKFILDEIEKNEDNEIVAWKYVSFSADFLCPKDFRMKVTIYND